MAKGPWTLPWLHPNALGRQRGTARVGRGRSFPPMRISDEALDQVRHSRRQASDSPGPLGPCPPFIETPEFQQFQARAEALRSGKGGK